MKKTITLISAAFISNCLLSQTTTQTITTSGTFTIPSTVNIITVEVIGGGGSGGGNGTGGGGGGGYSKGTFTITPSSTVAITIGNAGGTTSFGTLIQATGGGMGVSVPNPSVGGGGSGGVGSGGTFNYNGGAGGGGYYTYFGGGGGGSAGSTGNGGIGGNSIAWTGVCLTPGGSGGLSGGTPGGSGGKGAGFTDGSCTISNPSAGGINYGGGGGGGNGNGGGPGTGANGVCIITTFVTTGIDNLTSIENVYVLQNPFTNIIKLQNAIGDEKYELMSGLGQIVWSGKNIEENDFTSIGSGIYFLKVTSLNYSKTFKLIK